MLRTHALQHHLDNSGLTHLPTDDAVGEQLPATPAAPDLTRLVAQQRARLREVADLVGDRESA